MRPSTSPEDSDAPRKRPDPPEGETDSVLPVINKRPLLIDNFWGGVSVPRPSLPLFRIKLEFVNSKPVVSAPFDIVNVSR